LAITVLPGRRDTGRKLVMSTKGPHLLDSIETLKQAHSGSLAFLHLLHFDLVKKTKNLSTQFASLHDFENRIRGVKTFSAQYI
jgi:hypothetical protein